jgi:Flp pilus assembly protein TadD
VAGGALYGFGATPGLAILDSGEFLGAAATLGIPHPTGYPLYMLLGQLATLFPAGALAVRINWASAAAGAAAAFFFAQAAGAFARLKGWREGAATCAVGAAGGMALLGRTLWSVSTFAEVYALNAAFVGALLWLALRHRRTGARADTWVLAFVAGLALTNHLTAAVFVVAAGVISWPGRERARGLGAAVPLAAALFLLGASVNLYLPLRTTAPLAFNWNDPSTARALAAHLRAYQYSGNLWEDGLAGAAETWRLYRAAAWVNVTPWGVLALAGLVTVFAKGFRTVGAALTGAFAVYAAYCAVYAIPDILYYFIPLHLVITWLGAVGLGAAVAWLAERPRVRAGVVWAAAAAASVAAGVWAVTTNAPFGWRRGYVFAEYYGARLLAALPHRAVFLPGGDTNTFLTWYNLYARGRRPDVAVIDQIRLPSRGYLTGLAARHPELKLPTETEMNILAARALARGDFKPEDTLIKTSDDFIVPALLAQIIADNLERRPMFWGLGDPGSKIAHYIYPYGLVMELRADPPSRAELVRRADAGVRALAECFDHCRRADAWEFREPFFHPLAASLFRGMGDHLLTWGLTESEIRLFEAFTRLFPEDVNGWQNLGAAYAAAGQPAAAVPFYRRALTLAPENADLRVRYVMVLLEARRPGEAAAVVAGIKDAPPGQVDYLRALIYRENGRGREALAAFARAAPYYQTDAAFWREYGITRENAGDVSGAVAAYNRAAALKPDDARNFTSRGVAYWKLGREETAAADFETAVDLDPTDSQAHYNLACYYAARGDAVAATEHLRTAVELNPDRYVRMMEVDPDLAPCRETAAYRELDAAYHRDAGP